MAAKPEELERILKVAEDDKTWELIEKLESADNKDKVIRGIFPTPAEWDSPNNKRVVDLARYALFLALGGLPFVRFVAGIRWNIGGCSIYALMVVYKDISGEKHQGVGLVAEAYNGERHHIWFKKMAKTSNSFFKEEVEAILKVAEDDKTLKLIQELESADDKEKVVRGIIPTPKVVRPTDPYTNDIGKFAVSHSGTKLDFVRVVVGIEWSVIAGTIYALRIENKDASGKTHRGIGLVAKAIIGPKFLIWFKEMAETSNSFFKEEVEAILKVAEDDKTLKLIEELESADDKEKVVHGVIPTPKVVNPTDTDAMDIGKFAVGHSDTKLDFVRVVIGIKWNVSAGSIYALRIENKDASGKTHRGIGLVAKAIIGPTFLIWFKIIC